MRHNDRSNVLIEGSFGHEARITWLGPQSSLMIHRLHERTQHLRPLFRKIEEHRNQQLVTQTMEKEARGLGGIEGSSKIKHVAAERAEIRCLVNHSTKQVTPVFSADIRRSCQPIIVGSFFPFPQAHHTRLFCFPQPASKDEVCHPLLRCCPCCQCRWFDCQHSVRCHRRASIR